jgi:hypothetical protein
MNERIRELAVQARQEFLKLPTGYTPDQVGMYPQLMEKFAELIVRECAKFLDDNSGYNDSDGCWFPEPEDMLKYFGVEE